MVLDGGYKDLFYQIGYHPVKEVFLKGKRIFCSKGQIALEYVLMLLIFVSLALLIINLTTSESGFITRKWIQVIEFIGKDASDDIEVF